MFIEALFAVVQTRRQSKLPAVVKLIKKMWYVNTHPHIHTDTGLLLRCRKESKPAIFDNVDGS